MKYIVTKAYITPFLNPIELVKDEKVILSEDPEQPDDNPSTWVNWVYCIKEDGSNEGFVPTQIIKKEDGYGILMANYTATELTVEKGVNLKGIKELNGWLWAKHEVTESLGWIPLENVKKL